MGPYDYERIQRTGDTLLPNGGKRERGALVSPEDVARANATSQANAALARGASRFAIPSSAPITTTPIGQPPAPLTSLGTAPAQPGSFTSATGPLAPETAPTGSQVFSAAQLLRSVQGLLPGRDYSDKALAKATPEQIVAEAGLIKARLGAQNAQQAKAQSDAEAAAIKAIGSGGAAPAPSTPTAPGLIEVGGVNRTQEFNPTPGTITVDGLDRTPQFNPGAITAPHSPATPEAPKTAYDKMLDVLKGGGIRDFKTAQSLLELAQHVDDPNGDKAAQRHLDLGQKQKLADRGIDSRYWGTPEGTAETGLRQKQIDNLVGQIGGAKQQYQDTLKEIDAREAANKRSLVSAGLNSPALSPEDKSRISQYKSVDKQFEELSGLNAITPTEVDKQNALTLSVARRNAEINYSGMVNGIRSTALELARQNPNLKVPLFDENAPAGGAQNPAPGAATVKPGASPFDAIGAATAAATGATSAPAAAVPNAQGGQALVKPAAPAAAQSIDAQLSDIFFKLGEPGADVNALAKQRDALLAQKSALEGIAAQQRAQEQAAAAARAAAQERFNQLAAGTAPHWWNS